MATGTEAAALLHPEAVAHPPPFITMPGQTDWFMVAMGVFLVLAVVGVGVIYLKLHSLPERMAHTGQKVQFEIVAVLCLISLFTHNHLFWIGGLLLALVPMPDFSTPMNSMANSLDRMADAADEVPPERTEIGPHGRPEASAHA